MDRMKGLDGLRALAVLAVIQQHWGVAWLNRAIGPGGFGVNCFFVLSGFLITGILLSTRQPSDQGRTLTTFYLRRALRIFPAYYVMLLVAALVTRDVAEQWPWHAAYLSNVKLAIDQRWPGAAAHLWSLSVEEQFYLVWPALVLFTPRRLLEPVIAGVIVAGPIWRLLILSVTDGNGFAAANSLLGASDCLAIGGWLACRRERAAPPLPHVTLAAGVLVWIGGHIAGRMDPGSDVPVIAGGTSASLMFAWVVDRVSREVRGTGWLAWQPLVFIGTVSYGVYLVHNFVPALTNLVSPQLGAWMYRHGAGQFAAVALISVGLATVSWYAMERPLNDLKRYLPYSRPRPREVAGRAVALSAPALRASEAVD
jgi:peptidoglycan/LPS O-acetylase OafA/YrhL